jgi:hypothetical protein
MSFGSAPSSLAFSQDSRASIGYSVIRSSLMHLISPALARRLRVEVLSPRALAASRGRRTRRRGPPSVLPPRKNGFSFGALSGERGE